MTLLEAIETRHSVRKYKSEPLTEDIIKTLQEKVDECNRLAGLHIQLVTNETKAFTGMLSYGSFKGVENYLAMVGKKSDELDEKVGYYGEQLVLLAQTLGLSTCWVGLTYRKTDAYKVEEDEKLVCMIAVGYGETQGVSHKIKTVEQISNVSDLTPTWFRKGVEAALLAPSAVNQQKFSFEYIHPHGDGINRVKIDKGHSLIGYTKIDMGIAKLHFEIAAGKENFEWA